MSWSVGTLGGLAAYLHRPDGSFYYYAHLSATPQDLSSGSAVSPGDVIGYCGASGDASVPHVHFSYVNAAGVSVDPMSRLRTWLAEAEDSLPHASDRPTEVVEESVVPATPPWSEPIFTQAPEQPETPEVVETGVPAALKHPATVPGGAVLLGLPLLGLLRRRTREHLT